MLPKGYGSPVPDLVLYDYQSEQVKVIAEICQANGLKHETGNIIRLIDDNEYATLSSTTRPRNDGGMATASIFSQVLQLDLNFCFL
jgi:hypothetical protein